MYEMRVSMDFSRSHILCYAHVLTFCQLWFPPSPQPVIIRECSPCTLECESPHNFEPIKCNSSLILYSWKMQMNVYIYIFIVRHNITIIILRAYVVRGPIRRGEISEFYDPVADAFSVPTVARPCTSRSLILIYRLGCVCVCMYAPLCPDVCVHTWLHTGSRHGKIRVLEFHWRTSNCSRITVVPYESPKGLREQIYVCNYRSLGNWIYWYVLFVFVFRVYTITIIVVQTCECCHRSN